MNLDWLDAKFGMAACLGVVLSLMVEAAHADCPLCDEGFRQVHPAACRPYYQHQISDLAIRPDAGLHNLAAETRYVTCPIEVVRGVMISGGAGASAGGTRTLEVRAHIADASQKATCWLTALRESGGRVTAVGSSHGAEVAMSIRRGDLSLAEPAVYCGIPAGGRLVNLEVARS